MTDPIIGRPRCGNCEHARPDPRGNINQRVCKAGAPSCVALPNRQGIMVQAFWPVVAIDDDCDAWKMKQVPILGKTEGSG